MLTAEPSASKKASGLSGSISPLSIRAVRVSRSFFRPAQGSAQREHNEDADVFLASFLQHGFARALVQQVEADHDHIPNSIRQRRCSILCSRSPFQCSVTPMARISPMLL